MNPANASPRRATWRTWKNDLMMGGTVAATVITLAPLFLILGYLLSKGCSSLNLDFSSACPSR